MGEGSQRGAGALSSGGNSFLAAREAGESHRRSWGGAGSKLCFRKLAAGCSRACLMGLARGQETSQLQRGDGKAGSQVAQRVGP